MKKVFVVVCLISFELFQYFCLGILENCVSERIFCHTMCVSDKMYFSIPLEVMQRNFIIFSYTIPFKIPQLSFYGITEAVLYMSSY